MYATLICLPVSSPDDLATWIVGGGLVLLKRPVVTAHAWFEHTRRGFGEGPAFAGFAGKSGSFFKLPGTA